MAADEDCRTWWAAESGDPGEWLEMDLGKPTPVTALQVNFAEQDCRPRPDSARAETIRYKLLGSTNGGEWFSLVQPTGAGRGVNPGDRGPAETRNARGPHDYLPLEQPTTLRFVKVESVSTPAGGRFALRDVRVFGPGAGSPPAPVAAPQVSRHAGDDRNATIRWEPNPQADGYLIRFGVAPEALYHTIQVQGGTNSALTTHALNRGVRYRWRVDAFNASGRTPGAATGPL
jgi:hypothetical protein